VEYVLAHGAIADSPFSDQPTPIDPFPPPPRYDNDSCGVTAPRPGDTHNGTSPRTEPSSPTEKLPSVCPNDGVLPTSTPAGMSAAAASRPAIDNTTTDDPSKSTDSNATKPRRDRRRPFAHAHIAASTPSTGNQATESAFPAKTRNRNQAPAMTGHLSPTP
jgi:hypothetical protein